MCEKYGIIGNYIEKEISELVLELPKLFSELEKNIQSCNLKDIINYYFDFCLQNNTNL